MKDKLLLSIPCLSISGKLDPKKIYEKVFDKRVDRRYLDSSIQQFKSLNKKTLNFLGVDVDLQGTGNDLALSFHSSQYIGAIPIRMPYDGIAHKDLRVTPRFDSGKDVYADLTQILSKLEYSISPEYYGTMQLCNPMQMRPPMYYEAVKYIDLFAAACRYPWRKFDARNRSHPYPKSSTDWQKYSESSADPRKALVFPSRDSVLTTNHREWQELKYVFDIARGLVTGADTPSSIRCRYEARANSLAKIVSDIEPLFTESVTLRAHDPRCITELKKQANVILTSGSTQCTAWRMDMAELFERYVQTIVAWATRELSGIIYPNGKILGTGHIPAWGLRYLEPDISVRIGDQLYVADAKYKANYYAKNVDSNSLKETHRADLHQILAYCSFEPQMIGKTGILFYPANETRYRVIRYSADRLGGTTNKVILCGLAFGLREMDEASKKVLQLFRTVE